MKKTVLITVLVSFFINSFAQLKVSSSNNVGIGDVSDPGIYRLWVQNGNARLMFGANTNGTGANLFRLWNNVGSALSINSYNNLYSSFITDIGANYAVNGVNGYTQYCIVGSKYAPMIRLNADEGSISLFGENGPTTSSSNRSLYHCLGVYIASNGNVGIGNYSPSSALDVNGDIYIYGSLAISSDSRLKEDITTITSSLKNISSLRPVKYKLKQEINEPTSLLASNNLSDSARMSLSNIKQNTDTAIFNRYHNGFIAQEIQKIYPELVYTNKKGILSVDYIGLIPILTNALNEQETLIEKQSATIKSQNDDIALIKSQLVEIEKLLVKQKN
ncbi:MAG: tail fiber domain-containing protein [Bacteroidota bacterium]|nr:tail fiber domain-containing protein [Bacteroidota bacterium]